MKKSRDLLFLSMEIADGDVPSSIQILPFGTVTPADGRPAFNVTTEAMSVILDGWARRKVDVVVDYDHASAAPIYGMTNRAAGWVNGLEAREDGLWALVSWTPRAAQSIRDKEYRYLSPALMMRRVAGRPEPVALHSVALTNTPAIQDLRPVSFGAEPQEGEEMDLMQELKALLKTEDEAEVRRVVLSAIASQSKPNPEIVQLLGLSADADVTAATRKIREMQNTGGHVSLPEFMALKEKLERREAEDMVQVALSSGKVSPAQREWALKYATDDPQGFSSYLATQPPVVPLSASGAGGSGGDTSVTNEQRQVNAMLGIEEVAS
jgi:phage I-like protein